MKRTVILVLLMCTGIYQSLYSQYLLKNSNELEGYRSIPQEHIHIHINDTFLLTGEYLYYKVYCLEAERSTPSSISKIAYVELVGSDGKVVFKHKIKLSSGLGQGDFFIPTTVPSGSYKLIGYTQWMRNMGQETFFNADIAIVNPYQGLDESIQLFELDGLVNSNTLTQKIESDSTLRKEPEYYQISIPKQKYSKEELVEVLLNEVPDSILTNVERKPSDTVLKESSSVESSSRSVTDDFKLVLSKKMYRKRELVNFEIINDNQPLIQANFSISVRKLDSLPRFSPPNPQELKPDRKIGLNKTKLGDYVYLPELRGELLMGTVVSREGIPQPNQEIAISLSKTYPIIKTAKTDSNGKFYVNLNEAERNNEIELRVLGDNTGNKLIVVDKPNPVSYDDLAFKELGISREMGKTILERSVHNQIESAYFHKRNDSVLIGDVSNKLLHNLSETYILKEYQQFSTLKETIVEILDNVWIKKEKGTDQIHIRGRESFFVDSDEVPMVFIDGIFVEDISKLLEYDIKKIVSVSISRDKHYMGPQIFYGIMSITTSDRNFDSFKDDGTAHKATFLAPLAKKKYFFQGYSATVNEAQRKFPDFRYQLFWEPSLKMNTEQTKLSFYTGDNVGNFEISVHGYTTDGKPIFLSEVVKVE
ncbi:hypothetical protein [Flagellimonas sp.]|uniref:hypothetical protein n=1 Tax=Flagellimonas sp. TaxID=2058762 RepID=UPI003B5CD206